MNFLRESLSMKPQYLTRPIKPAVLSALTLFFACAVMTVSAKAMPGNAPSGQPAPHNEGAAALQTMLNEAQAIFQSCREEGYPAAECAQARREFITSNGETATGDTSTTATDDLPQ